MESENSLELEKQPKKAETQEESMLGGIVDTLLDLGEGFVDILSDLAD